VTSEPVARDKAITTVIEAPRGWALLNFRELWQFRELLWMLVMRDIKLRYKQTVLGVAWAILQPLVAMVVFTIILSGAAGVSSAPGIPYPVYSYSGLVLWFYFSSALNNASTSMVTNKVLVSKVYFPRLIAPFSSIVSPLFDLVFAMSILIVLIYAYGLRLSWVMVFAPLFILAAALCAGAFGVWLAALNVGYRDIGYAVPIVVQLWMFLTPTVYSPAHLSTTLRLIYSLNPMAGIMIAFRWSMLHRGSVPWGVLGTSLGVLFVVLVSGIAYFKRVERTFADVI
jgi:lipopolysaccharide transport system permease protein